MVIIITITSAAFILMVENQSSEITYLPYSKAQNQTVVYLVSTSTSSLL